MTSHDKKLDKLSNFFPAMMKNFPFRRKFLQHCVFYYWKKIVGDGIADHVHPVRFDFFTLYLNADSSGWLTTIRYMQGEIIDKINSFVANEIVREIRFGFDFRNGDKAETEGNEGSEKIKIDVEPTDEENEKAEKACCKIEDDSLRAAATRAFSMSMAKRRAELSMNYRQCEKCGRMMPPDEKKCPVCERRKNEEKGKEIRKLLKNRPYLTYGEIANMFDCDPRTVMMERMKMIHQIGRKIEYGDTSSENAKMLVMLVTKTRPEELNEKIIEKTLRKYRFEQCQNWENYNNNKKEKSPSKKEYGAKKKRDYLSTLSKRKKNKNF